MNVNEPRAFAVGSVLIAFIIAALSRGIVQSAHDVQQALKEERHLAPGNPAPDAILYDPDLSGKSNRLQLSWKGTMTHVLIFWWPRRHPARVDPSAGIIRDAVLALRKLRAEVIVITPQESKEETSKAQKEIDAVFKVARTEKPFRAYRAFPYGLPKAFVIDQQGVIRLVNHRLRADSVDEVVGEVRKLAASKK